MHKHNKGCCIFLTWDDIESKDVFLRKIREGEIEMAKRLNDAFCEGERKMNGQRLRGNKAG